MLPRLEAEEQLRQLKLATVTSPYCDAEYREQVVAEWTALASGQPPRPTHDARGYRLLHSGKELRQWLMLEGDFREEELTDEPAPAATSSDSDRPLRPE